MSLQKTRFFVGIIAAIVGGSGILSAGTVSGTPCATDTLANYKVNYGPLAPCGVGPLSFYSFDFAKISAAGAITTSDITMSSDGVSGLIISSPLFSGPFAAQETYVISYIVDPAPIVVGDSLSLSDSDLAFGIAGIDPFTITKYSCPDKQFAGAVGNPAGYTCSPGGEAPFKIQVSFSSPSASVTYVTPAEKVGIRLVLDFPGTNSTFTFPAGGFSTETQFLPEPGSMGMLSGGLLALLGLARHRAKRS